MYGCPPVNLAAFRQSLPDFWDMPDARPLAAHATRQQGIFQFLPDIPPT
ncbi:MAG: hypothetical protein K8J31_04425 [Anaerolineae bacterium]|nr:hypothetical protein [Anaerolineae bacterium]